MEARIVGRIQCVECKKRKLCLLKTVDSLITFFELTPVDHEMTSLDSLLEHNHPISYFKLTTDCLHHIVSFRHGKQR
jgi:hypothetical protein